jgi:hypothetical protein
MEGAKGYISTYFCELKIIPADPVGSILQQIWPPPSPDYKSLVVDVLGQRHRAASYRLGAIAGKMLVAICPPA